MSRLTPDDDIHRARLVYLGPPGYTFPIHLPYGQYGLFVLLVPLFMFLRWLFTQQPPDFFPAYEIALAMVTTSVVFQYVNHDRPARKVIKMAFTDWRRSRTADSERRQPALTARKVRIRGDIA